MKNLKKSKIQQKLSMLNPNLSLFLEMDTLAETIDDLLKNNEDIQYFEEMANKFQEISKKNKNNVINYHKDVGVLVSLLVSASIRLRWWNKAYKDYTESIEKRKKSELSKELGNGQFPKVRFSGFTKN